MESITKAEYLERLDKKNLFEGGLENPLERQRLELFGLIEKAIEKDSQIYQLSKYFNFKLGLDTKKEANTSDIPELYWCLEIQYKKDIDIIKRAPSEEKFISKQMQNKYFDFDYSHKAPYIWEIEDDEIESRVYFYKGLLYCFYHIISAGIVEINREIDEFNDRIQNKKDIDFKIQYEIATRLSHLSKEMKEIIALIGEFDELNELNKVEGFEGAKKMKFHNLILDFNIIDIGLEQAKLALS